jgi:hypothetical protein
VSGSRIAYSALSPSAHRSSQDARKSNVSFGVSCGENGTCSNVSVASGPEATR